MTDAASHLALSQARDALDSCTKALQDAVAALATATTALASINLGPPTKVVAKSLSASVDATAAIQMDIDSMPVGMPSVVVIPEGYSFWVNGDPAKCLKLRSNVTLQIDGTLKVKASSLSRTYAVLVEGVFDAAVVFGSAGQIIGDAQEHTFLADTTPTDEWGMGIAVYGSSFIKIQGGRISQCTGDGIVVGRQSSDIEIDGVVSTQNRRQGLTIGRAQGVTVRNCEFSNTAGAKPSAGIDIEPDSVAGSLCEDVLIENCKLLGNAGNGIETNAITKDGLTPVLRNIKVIGCELAGNAYGLYAQKALGLIFDGNNVHDNRWQGVSLRNGTSTAKAIEGNVFFNNKASTGSLDRNPDKVAAGFVEARDMAIEITAGTCTAGVNTYK